MYKNLHSLLLIVLLQKNSTVLAVSRRNFLSMQKEDAAFASKLLMTLVVQKEANRPGRTRTRVPFRKNSSDSVEPVHADESMAERLLAGDDYEISLTEAQIERVGKVFDFISMGETDVPMDSFANYVSMEARLLGSALEHQEFMEMIDASGIDGDQGTFFSHTNNQFSFCPFSNRS